MTRTDLRTGLPCTNAKATRKNLRDSDREIRTDINARVLGLTGRLRTQWERVMRFRIANARKRRRPFRLAA